MKNHRFPQLHRLNLRILAVLLAAISIAHPASAQAPNDLITLGRDLRFHVVDKTGEAIKASAVPKDLRTRLEGIQLGNGDLESAGLVLAKVKLPTDEKNVHYGSSLVGKGWYGGMHYLNVGNGNNPDVVCIRVAHRDGGCRLELKKLNYKPIVIPVPPIDPTGKIIWLGELSPERCSPGETQHEVSGKVAFTSGSPVDGGEATLRVNGTPANVRVPIVNGNFTFRDVGPGDYLVEFWIDGYSAKTWWVSVKEGDQKVTSTITAHPLRRYLLQVHDQDDSRKMWLTAGIPYRDRAVNFQDRNSIRFTQEGDRLVLYSPGNVSMRIGGEISRCHSCTVVLKKGDTVELLAQGSEKVLHKIECLDVVDPNSPPALAERSR
jgi:hypothetical protein